MPDIEKICKGIYNAEIGQCQVDDGAVSDTSGGIQTGWDHETVGREDSSNSTIRGSLHGGFSSLDYSGFLEGKKLNTEEREEPLDLQICWSDKKNQQSICSQFSSFPSPYSDNHLAGISYRLAKRNFGAHAAAGWASARFNDPLTPLQTSSAVFNGGIEVQGRPWGGFSLASADYFLTCKTERGVCDDETLHQLALQGLTRFPFSTTKHLFLSGDTVLAPADDSQRFSSIRIQGSFTNDHFSTGILFKRQPPLFEINPLDRLALLVRQEIPFENGFDLGLEIEGAPLLLREGVEEKGYDFQITPSLSFRALAEFRGYYRHAALPTGGGLKEIGGRVASLSDFPIERLHLFAGGSEFFWEDPLFDQPRSGFNAEAGGFYCLGKFCFDVAGQYNLRQEGDPFPSGDNDRWHVMTTLRYLDQPGSSSPLSPIAARRLTAHGLKTSSPNYPMSHFAAPRLLYNPSPLPGGVWPFNIPKRKDGAKTFDAGVWYEKTHPPIAELRQSDPAAVETWIKKGHGNALKELLAQGVDGVCASCHVDKYGMQIVKEWIDGGTVSKNLLDKDDQIPNPWYSADEAKKFSEAGKEYPHPETLMMAGAVRCQKEECHSVNHTGYVRHILGLKGERHHGVDALSQAFEYSLSDKASAKSLLCFGCHEGPGSDVNRNIHGFISTQPLIACEFCHTQRGPFNHASKKWGPSVHNGGDHGKVYWQEAKTRGVNNVSCRSCHEPVFCTACHSQMNTHGQTELERQGWGRGGKHSFSGVTLAQGKNFLKANQERGANCWVCHESQQNCFDPCHSGQRVTAHRFHPAGMINRHQAELDTLALRCNSCHQEKRGVPAVAAVNHQINCRECHMEAITDRPRNEPPHPVGWANRRAGQKTMHGEAVCDRGGPGVCFQCHSSNEKRNPEGPLSCFNSTCHQGLETDQYGTPSCTGGR